MTVCSFCKQETDDEEVFNSDDIFAMPICARCFVKNLSAKQCSALHVMIMEDIKNAGVYDLGS